MSRKMAKPCPTCGGPRELSDFALYCPKCRVHRVIQSRIKGFGGKGVDMLKADRVPRARSG